MPRRHREGDEISRTRQAILDAADQILDEEGYSAVSSRKVAKVAGLKSQLVHYYFQTMDDLFLALYKRRDDEYADLLIRAFKSDQPLSELWKINTVQQAPRTSSEFVALATHRPAIKAEIARSAERNRRMQAALIAASTRNPDAPFEPLSSTGLAMLITAISRSIYAEDVLGVTVGHDELAKWMNNFIGQIERDPGSGETNPS